MRNQTTAAMIRTAPPTPTPTPTPMATPLLEPPPPPPEVEFEFDDGVVFDAEDEEEDEVAVENASSMMVMVVGAVEALRTSLPELHVQPLLQQKSELAVLLHENAGFPEPVCVSVQHNYSALGDDQ